MNTFFKLMCELKYSIAASSCMADLPVADYLLLMRLFTHRAYVALG